MTPLYIFDLDGTLADIRHRRHLVESATPNWEEFNRQCVGDLPIWPTITTLRHLRASGAEIEIWTGRSETVRTLTMSWLASIDCGVAQLLMRPAGDHRPDTELKAEWLSHLPPKEVERLIGVFEDRARMVKMWRERGVTCYQVDEGNY